jgi:hypothetical protein
VNGDAAAQMAAAAGAEDEGLAEVAQEVDVAEMEAECGWKRGARRARAMAKQTGGWTGGEAAGGVVFYTESEVRSRRAEGRRVGRRGAVLDGRRGGGKCRGRDQGRGGAAMGESGVRGGRRRPFPLD